MSSDLYYSFDGYFFSDPFSPFSDTLQTIPNNTQNLQNPIDEANCFDPIVFSTSPPSHQLQNLSLCQTTTATTTSFQDQFSDFSALEVKSEECQVPIDCSYGYQSLFGPHSYGGGENVRKMMQRSHSISHSFDGKPTSFLFQPCFDSVLESPNYQQQQVLSSPENSFSRGQIRRVCSTGDLQKMKTSQANQRLSASPLATESSFMEEANFKVGRYSAEERKERIDRYRAKRTQRNFNKTIKYACRKTLADNRPRVRGRFARNDETGETPKVGAANHPYEDEDDLWIDGFNEEDEGGGQFFNISGPTQIQYYGY